jgi:hypothetical protein
MTHMAQVSLVVGVLVSVILIGADAFSASADNLRKIVRFVDGRPLALQQTLVAQSGSPEVQTLSLINALAIQLPAVGTAQVLAYLQGIILVAGGGVDDGGGDGAEP